MTLDFYLDKWLNISVINRKKLIFMLYCIYSITVNNWIKRPANKNNQFPC